MTWRRLRPECVFEHRLDSSGFLLLRGAGGASSSPPFTTMRKARNGRGGFGPASLESRGFGWQRAGDGWALRSKHKGAAALLSRARSLYGAPAEKHATVAGLDPRFVLVTIACESGARAPDAEGLVKAPRTERGYPRRTGESDPGDFDRDLEDWEKARGRHSSHGLMQTLISTAIAVRPDLFANVDPSRYRTVLWSPSNSIACGVAAMRGLLARWPDAQNDPLAMRVVYASGGLHKDVASPWGVVLFDELIPVSFAAAWNDLACVLGSADCPALPATGALAAPAKAPSKATWIAVAFSAFAVSVASAWAAAHHMKRVSA
jgi:hypothetical protein